MALMGCSIAGGMQQSCPCRPMRFAAAAGTMSAGQLPVMPLSILAQCRETYTGEATDLFCERYDQHDGGASF